VNGQRRGKTEDFSRDADAAASDPGEFWAEQPTAAVADAEHTALALLGRKLGGEVISE
jgi:hypothetical protein